MKQDIPYFKCCLIINITSDFTKIWWAKKQNNGIILFSLDKPEEASELLLSETRAMEERAKYWPNAAFSAILLPAPEKPKNPLRVA